MRSKIDFKLLSLCSLAVCCSSSFALELKLKCNIVVQINNPSGYTEKNNSTATVEVLDLGLKKYIFITSPNADATDFSVGSHPNNEKNIVRTGEDFSDSGKWDVSTVSVDNSGLQTRSDRRIFIDRNTGEIIARNVFKVGNTTRSVSVSGSCDKIDQGNKKF
jgi:hypothetical protein